VGAGETRADDSFTKILACPQFSVAGLGVNQTGPYYFVSDMFRFGHGFYPYLGNKFLKVSDDVVDAFMAV
jgi:hypothetical protein